MAARLVEARFHAAQLQETIQALNGATPAVSAVAPTNGAANVGDNAIPVIVFNKLMNTQTIHAQSIALLATRARRCHRSGATK